MECMKMGFESIKGHFSVLEPQAELSSQIVASIQTLQKRQVRMRVLFFGAIALVAGAVALATVWYLYHVFVSTQLQAYVSLAFSGDAVVYVYWKELLLSILESLPLLSIITLLCAMLFFVWSFAHTLGSVQKLHVLSHA